MDIINVIKVTFKEAYSRKIILMWSIFFLLLIVGSTTFVYYLKNSESNIPVYLIKSIPHQMMSFISTFYVLFSIFMVSPLFSSFYEKGIIDLYLSKPISRENYIIGRFIAVSLLVIISFFIFALYSVILVGVLFNIYYLGVFWDVVIYSFVFITLQSILLFFSTLTRSSVAGTVISLIILMVLSPLLEIFSNGNLIINKPVIKGIVDILYYIVPKTQELLGKFANDLVLSGYVKNYQPVITTFLFFSFMFTLSIIRFSKKDY